MLYEDVGTVALERARTRCWALSPWGPPRGGGCGSPESLSLGIVGATFRHPGYFGYRAGLYSGSHPGIFVLCTRTARALLGLKAE